MNTTVDPPKECTRAVALPLTLLPRDMASRGKARRDDVARCKRDLTRIARQLRDAQNAMIRYWFVHHCLAGTPAALVRRGPGLVPITSDLTMAMYYAGRSAAPDVAARVVSLATHWLCQTIRVQRSPRSNWRRWQAVLLPANTERLWHWDHAQPIRIDANCAKIELVGGDIRLTLRPGCDPITAVVKGQVARDKTLRPNGPGQNGAKYNERWQEFADKLSVNACLVTERGGKWFFTYLQRKPAPKLPIEKTLPTLFIRTGNRSGLRCRFRGRSTTMIGREALLDLADARRRQIARRSELKARNIGFKSRKAKEVKGLWANYCATLIGQTVSEIVKACVRCGVRRIGCMAGDEWCALGSVGNDELDPKEPTRFPFAEFLLRLREKGEEHGILVVTRPNFRSIKRRKLLAQKRIERNAV